MIVNKPINIKIDGVMHRLKVGQTAPSVVVDFWNKTNSISILKSGGIISEESTTKSKSKKAEVVTEVIDMEKIESESF